MRDAAFVSMPFGDSPDSHDNEWTKLFDHGLKPLESPIKRNNEYRPVTLLRADRKLESLGLKANVAKLIDQATIVICVLTTSVQKTATGHVRISNPNVLWELGHAEALGKPIVVLADNDSVRNLPVLAGVPNVCIYNHKLVTAAKRNDLSAALEKVARDLAPFITVACKEARSAKTATTRNRVTTYANRDEIDLPGLIADADQHVDILTTNVSYFLHGKFSSRPEHPLARALKKGATVRIVTMDPESVIAEYRARQLGRGHDVPGYRKELRDAIVRLYHLFGSRDRFYFKIYNDLPLQITTRINQTIITSVVTRGDQARKRIAIQFNVHDDGVTESFVAHFQSMFEDSKDVKGVAWIVRQSLDGTGSGSPSAVDSPASRSGQQERDQEKGSGCDLC
jgi:hypothetical protein